MKLLTPDQAAVWCNDRGVSLGANLASTKLTIPGGAGHEFRVRVKDENLKAVDLSYLILQSSSSLMKDDAPFEGGLIWLHDWDIWSESVERVGHALLHGLRSGSAEQVELAARPAHLFESTDFVAAQALLMLTVLFQWDAYFVPRSAHLIAQISHEGYVAIRSATLPARETLLARFVESGWDIA